jgi:polysaccharide export outer membrane protein
MYNIIFKSLKEEFVLRRTNLLLLISLSIITFIVSACASTPASVVVEEEKTTQKETTGEPEKKPLDFILGAGDTIEIVVYRNDDLKRTLRVDHSGRIMFPLIGDVQVAGKTIFQLRDEMKERLSRYLVDPQITINVSTVQSQKIIILGEVNSPGILTLDSPIDILEAVARAGGLTADAKSQNILLIRKFQGKNAVASVNLKNIFGGGDPLQNIPLQGGDIVYVPRVFIADISWFFSHFGQVLSPLVNLESGIVLWPQVKDVFSGKEGATTPLSIPATR